MSYTEGTQIRRIYLPCFVSQQCCNAASQVQNPVEEGDVNLQSAFVAFLGELTSGGVLSEFELGALSEKIPVKSRRTYDWENIWSLVGDIVQSLAIFYPFAIARNNILWNTFQFFLSEGDDRLYEALLMGVQRRQSCAEPNLLFVEVFL